MPLTGNGSTANLGITWQLDQPASGSNPQVSLNVALIDPALDTQSIAALQSLVPWAAAITTAADQTGVLTNQLPLVNETLAQLSGLAPSTSSTFPGLLNVIAGAINTYATSSGATTDNFLAGIDAALATFSAANPGYAFTASGSAGETTSSAAAQALGLPAGTDVLQFNLVVTGTSTASQTLSLNASASDNNIAFSTSGTASGSVTLNITVSVALSPQLSAQDATFVQLNGLNVTGTAGVGGSFPIGIGLLGATVTAGALSLNANASIGLVSDGNTPEPNTVSDIIGVSAADLLVVTGQPSSVTATLPVTASFGDLINATATLAITGNPLSASALSTVFTGSNGTNFQSFANLAPTDLLGGLSNLAAAMTDVGASAPLAVDVPLTNVTVGTAADFGTAFDADVVAALSNNPTHTPTFASIQQFQADLAALPGVTGSSVTYTSGSNQIAIGFTLAESFAATPASFTYDLSSTTDPILSQLSDVLSTSAKATLSVSGTGTVSVAFDFSLKPNAVQVQGDLNLPQTGVLIAGSDAHFTLSLSAPRLATPTLVPVTIAASATQANATAAQLLTEINAALQSSLTGKGLATNLVTATAAGRVLVLTLTPGTFTDMSVITAPQDAAVYELGLAPAQIPTAAIIGNVALPTNGQLSANATFTVTTEGSAATPITITAAPSNTSRSQLLTQVQTALQPLNTSLASANRSPITVSLTSAGFLSFSISGYDSTLSITAANTEAQTILGLLPSQSVEAGAPVVSVMASAGPVPSDDILPVGDDQTFTIAVDGLTPVSVTLNAAATQGNTAANAEAANTTPQQMLADEINTVLAPVNATLQADGLAEVTVTIGTPNSNAMLDAGQSSANTDGVLFFSTLGANASIVVKAAAGNLLGIGTDDISSAATLSVAGGQSFAGNIELTKLSLNGTLSLTGTIGATADLGVVVIDLGPGAISISPTVAVNVDGGYTLATLTALPGQIGNYSNATLGGAASITLPVSAADGLSGALGLNANAALTLNSTDMFTLSGWTANTAALEGLASLPDFSFAQAKQAVSQLGSVIAASVANPDGLFGQSIPRRWA